MKGQHLSHQVETVGALITHQGQLVQRGLGSGGRTVGQLVLDRFQQLLVGERLVGFVIGLGHAWSRWCSVPGGTGLRGSSSWCSRFKASPGRSEEHTSELQSRPHLVCRLLLEKKKTAASPTSFSGSANANASDSSWTS